MRFLQRGCLLSGTLGLMLLGVPLVGAQQANSQARSGQDSANIVDQRGQRDPRHISVGTGRAWKTGAMQRSLVQGMGTGRMTRTAQRTEAATMRAIVTTKKTGPDTTTVSIVATGRLSSATGTTATTPRTSIASIEAVRRQTLKATRDHRVAVGNTAEPVSLFAQPPVCPA